MLAQACPPPLHPAPHSLCLAANDVRRRVIGRHVYFLWERLSASIFAAGKPLPQERDLLARGERVGFRFAAPAQLQIR